MRITRMILTAALLMGALFLALMMLSEESEALECYDNKVNFDKDEVEVRYRGQLIEPLTTITQGYSLIIIEKTGYCNITVNGEPYVYQHPGLVITAGLRDSGILIRAEKKEYNIIFNANGGSGQSIQSLSGAVIGEEYQIEDIPFEKSFYYAQEWNTKADGTGFSISPGMMVLSSTIIENLFEESSSAILYPKWIPIEYSFGFNSNGGNGELPETIANRTILTNAVIPEVSVSRTGYYSVVWNTSSDGTGFDVSPGNNTFTSNFINGCFGSNTSVTLYPKWVRYQYSISFYMDGDGVTPDTLEEFTIGSVVTIPPADFTKTGYTMVGWNTSAEGNGRSFSGGELEIDADLIEDIFGNETSIRLYSIWSPIQYSISFNINNGSGNLPNTISGITISSNVIIPAVNVTRTGYSCAVWNTSPDGTGDDFIPQTRAVSSNFITEYYSHGTNLVLYPKWVERAYSISFYMDGDGAPPNPIINITIGSTVNVPSANFTKTGYRMTEWNTSAEGDGRSFAGGSLSVDSALIESIFSSGQDIQFFSMWEPIQYSVSFSANGGTGVSPVSLTNRTILTGATVPDIPFSRIGYSTSVWNTAPDGTGTDVVSGTNVLTAVSINTLFGQNTSITLYPKWTEIRYSISFIMDGNGVSPNPINNFTIGSTISIPAATFTKTGYTMTGWNSSEDGTGSSFPGGNLTIDSDIILALFAEGQEAQLFSMWTPIIYTIGFGANNGMGDVPATLTNKTILTGAIVPDVQLTRVGYSTSMWNTSSNGSGTDISPGTNLLTVVSINTLFGQNNSITLYPKWVENRYSISFVMDGNGVSPGPINNFTIGSTIAIPATTFTKTGYTMTGWNTLANGTGRMIDGGSLTVDSDIIQSLYSEGFEVQLFSVWSPVVYSIQFAANNGTGNVPGTLSERTILTGATVPDIPFSRIGYSTSVWNTSANGSGTDVSPRINLLTERSIIDIFGQNTSITLYPKWVENRYSISFVMDGNGVSPGPINNFTIGSTIAIPATTFTKTGYTMSCWNSSANGSGVSLSGGELTMDPNVIQSLYPEGLGVQLYPVWTPISYSILFNANDGTGNVPETISGRTILTGAIVPSVPLSRIGYNTSVWNTSADGTGVDISPESNLLTAGSIDSLFGQNTSITLYPKWVKNRYSISFVMDGDGVSPNPINNFTIGSTISIPATTFTKTGYTMTSWNSLANGTGLSLPGGNLVIDSNIISSLYAEGFEAQLFSMWTPIRYSIGFNANNGTGNVPETMSERTIITGAIAPSVPLSRVGYSTSVWNTSANGSGTDIAPGTDMLTAVSINTLFSGSTGITLYPKWIENRYSISFVMDGDGVPPDPINNFVIGSTVPIPATTFTKTGYSMTGWNSLANGTGATIEGGDLVIDSDIILSLYEDGFEVRLYSMWEPIIYSVRFAANNGTGDVPEALLNRTIVTGANVPDITLTRIGYSVETWNTSPDGTGTDVNPRANVLTARSITDLFGQNTSITLYPKWVENRYSISFVMDGNGVSPSPINNFTIGSTISIPATTFTKTGYSMTGWNSRADGTGAFVDGGSLIIDSDVILSLYPDEFEVQLFSMWTPIRYSVCFAANNGTGNVPETLSDRTIVTGAIAPAIPFSRVGYSVSSWNTSANGTGADITPNTNLLTAGSIDLLFGENTAITLYPKWVENRYSLSFVMDGDGVSPSPINNFTIGSTITIPATTFTKTGYTMTGWNSQANGSGTMMDGGSLTVDSAVIQSLYSDGFEAQLFSIWTPIRYSVQFSANNGTGEVPETLSDRTIVTGAIAPVIPLSRVGYSVSLWNTSANGSGIDITPNTNILTAVSIDSLFSESTSITLYPKWVENRYSLSFVMDGDGTSPNPINNITIGSTISIPATTFTRTGYTMSCWNSLANGMGMSFSGGELVVDAGIISGLYGEDSEAQLYSVWTPIRYSVRFGANNGTGDVPETLSERTIVTGANVPDISLTRVGYSVGLWNTSSDGSGTDISPGTNLMTERYIIDVFGENTIVTLYPKWVENRYSILFVMDGNGVSPNPINNFTIGSTVTIPATTFTKTGYTMTGWNTRSNSTGVMVDGGSLTVDSDLIQSLYPEGFEAQLYSVWTPIVYSIRFSGNSGVGDVPETMSDRTIVTGAIVPAVTLTRVGYSTSVWNTASDGTGVDINPGMDLLTAGSIDSLFGDNTNLILYPKWAKNRYSVSFVMDGDGTSPNPINNFTIDSTITIPAASFTKTGYTMSCWNSSANGSGMSFSGGDLVIDAGIITGLYSESSEARLYSVWTPIRYSIQFSANNGTGDVPETLSERTIVTGADVPDIQLTRVGYTVGSWNTSPDGTGADIAPNTNILTARSISDNFGGSTSITLYPKWVEKRYSISFRMDGDGTSPDPITNITVGSAITIPDTAFTKTGYTMTGWNSSANGTGRNFTGGTLIFDPGVITDLFGDSLETQLYSVWSPINYSIIFNANNGVGSLPEMMYERKVTTPTIIPSVELSRTGYSVSIWNTAPDGSGLDVNPGTNVMTVSFINDNLSENTAMTLYPKWVEKRYSISFRMDGDGTSPDPLNNITIGSPVNIPSADHTKTGYTMVEWNTSEDGSGRGYAGGRITADTEFIESVFDTGTEARLYSVWSPCEYRVTLATERGSITGGPWIADEDLMVTFYTIESDDIPLPAPETDDRFHTFVGWEDQNGNAVQVIGHGSVGDMPLHAVWSSNEFSMNIVVNGRTVEEKYTLESTLPDPECEEGFAFRGWFYRDESGQEMQFTQMSQMKEGMFLYAVFEPVKDDPVEMISFVAVLVSIFGIAMFMSFRGKA